MFKVIVLVAVALVRSGLSQPRIDCNGKWSTQVNCLRTSVARDAKNDYEFPMPDQGERDRIKRAVSDCFKQVGCYDSPVPINSETNDRRSCFRRAKRQIDQSLKTCVNRMVNGWNPVDDYASMDLDEWGFTVKLINSGLRNSRNYCRDNSRNNQIRQCIQQTVNYDFSRSPPSRLPRYWCEDDARCWADTTPHCQQQWSDQVQPALCRCSRMMSNMDNDLNQAINTYKNCYTQNKNNDPGEDPGLMWLRNYVSNLCLDDGNQPCRAQRQKYRSGWNSWGGKK